MDTPGRRAGVAGVVEVGHCSTSLEEQCKACSRSVEYRPAPSPLSTASQPSWAR